MANKLEIEKKYQIKDTTIQELGRIIKKSGARYVGKNKQRDIYFNVPGRDSLTSKECLRIRESGTKKEITYKPPTQKVDMKNDFFSKKEVDLSIQNIETAKTLLLDIGCTVLAEVRKERRVFELDKFKIFIDNVQDIGLFLEIEILDDFSKIKKGIVEIDSLLNNLKINCKIENKPYRDLVIKKEEERQK